MGDLVPTGSKYSDEDRRKAVVLYATNGLMSAVSRETGIAESTLCEWKKSDWWDVVAEEVRSEIGDRILAQNMEIASKAAAVALDNLKNGDEKLVWDKDKKEHVIKRVKLGAYHSMLVSGISQDKARVQLNLPTSISGKAEDYQALAKQFKELSEQWDEKQANVVATQNESKVD